jgi:hypothetical protein
MVGKVGISILFTTPSGQALFEWIITLIKKEENQVM